jgi:ketosteroid isomerase-like protein
VQESTELRELIIGCFRALENGDAEFFERHVLCGAELRLIGATSEEWFGAVEGFDLLRQQAANGRGELRAAAEQVEAYSTVTSAGVLQ